MSSLRGRCRRSKKANPYAGRGLDKFALVSAELEAKREKLAAQLGTPMSMVKFAIGSHNKWIPIVLSGSTKKESSSSKKKTAGLVAEGKPVVDGSLRKGGLHSEGKPYVGGLINEDSSEQKVHESGFINGQRAYVGGNTDTQRTQLSGRIDDNILSSEKSNTNLALLNGLNTQEETHLNNLLNEDEASLDDQIHQNKTSLGGLLGSLRSDLGEIVEIFSASSDANDVSADEKEVETLQGYNDKGLMGAAWVVSKASTLASSVVFFIWHPKSMGKNTAPAEKAPKGKVIDETRASNAVMASSSPSPSEKSPASSPVHQVLPLPSPPLPIKTAGISSPSDESVIAEMVEDISNSSKEAFKQKRKFKGKGFLKTRSAPCTPRDSRKGQKLFTAASVPPETHGLNDQANHTNVKDEQSIATQRATYSQNAVIRSRLSRVSSAENAQKERARRVGQALAATGLILSLSGLMMGYVSAILGVVCWWYVLPSLRKVVGDKPTVRSRDHSHDTNNNTKALNIKSKSNNAIKPDGTGKYDLESHDYKKKVIMDGLLDRGRRSNA